MKKEHPWHTAHWLDGVPGVLELCLSALQLVALPRHQASTQTTKLTARNMLHALSFSLGSDLFDIRCQDFLEYDKKSYDNSKEKVAV